MSTNHQNAFGGAWERTAKRLTRGSGLALTLFGGYLGYLWRFTMRTSVDALGIAITFNSATAMAAVAVVTFMLGVSITLAGTY